MALEGSKAPKFQRMARVLPQNEKSFNLIKEEEAKEAAAREKEQAVSIKCHINLNFFNTFIWISNCQVRILTCTFQQQKALRDREVKDLKKREREQQREREKRDKAAAEQAKK